MKSEKRVLFLLAASAAGILLVTVLMLFSRKDEPVNEKRPSVRPTKAVSKEEVTAEHNRLMMIKSVDTEESTITLYDLESGDETTLSYDVAADIRTKFGSLTYAASLVFGEIVRAEYNKDRELVRMRLSDEHWELQGVEDFTISDSMLTLNGVNYKITEHTVAYCEGARIDIGEVKDMDRVALCGVESELLTVCVMKGHGSIKLVNTTEFQEAKVTFGDESHILAGEPSYLVREGTYTVAVNGEKHAASVEVTVARNEQLVIDLYEYGGAPAKTAQVRFKVTPFSSILKIDGERVDYYEQDLVLEYGEHKVEAELGGYVTYKGYLNIKKPYHTFQIDLPERPADDPAEGDGEGTNTGDGSGAQSGEQNHDGAGQTGDTTGDGTLGGTGEETTERRFVPIGEAGGYEYDDEFRTFLLEPAGAVVLIDGISLGKAPVEFEKILGTYTVTLKKNGKEKSYTVTVDEDSFDGDVYWKFSMN